MLSLRVVDGHSAVDAAGDEQATLGGVRDLGEGLVELGELVGDTCPLDIEDSEDARLEAACKKRQRGMGGDTEGLVDGGRELVDLVGGLHIPEPDCLVSAYCQHNALAQVEVHAQDLVRVRSQEGPVTLVRLVQDA